MKCEKTKKIIQSIFRHMTGIYTMLGLVIILFVVEAFDFIIGGKSSLAIHYERPFLDYKALQISGVTSDIVNRSTGESWIDIGGSAFQSNPISYVVNNSKSVFWTDLIASGNGIIEDFTFQPLSVTNLVSTIVGPNLYYSHVSFLVVLFLAFLSFSIYLNKRHELDVVPSVIGGLCFCFTGYVTSGWSNTVVLPYLVFPTALLAISYYLQGRIKIYLPILLTAILLLNTFLPVLLLCLFAIPMLVLCEKKSLTIAESIKLVTIKIGVIYIVSFAVVAFAYLPAFAQFIMSGSFSEYNNKSNDFYLPWKSLFLFLGPLHPWRNFNSLYFDNFEIWKYGGFSVPYFGIVCTYLLMLSMFCKQRVVLILWAVGLLFMLRLYTPLAYYVKYIPILRSVSYGYVFSLISVIISVLVAFGAQFFVRSNDRIVQIGPLVLLLAAELAYYHLSVVGNNTIIQFLISLLLIFSLFVMTFLASANLKLMSLATLIAIELFVLQNHDKVQFKNLDEISLRPAIKSIFSDATINEYRVLNTGFHILPQNLTGALNLAEISTMGHLSLDRQYKDLYSENIGTDDAQYAIHGFTDCRNLKFNNDYLDDLAVKYVLTDRAFCSTIFAGRFPVEFQDDSVLVFRNPTAKKIVSVEPDSLNRECTITSNYSQLSRIYTYNNCHGSLNIRINFKNDFEYFQDGVAVVPSEIHPIGKSFLVDGTGRIEISYSKVYLYSIFISAISVITCFVYFFIRRRRNAQA